jgi:hypothetical protein
MNIKAVQGMVAAGKRPDMPAFRAGNFSGQNLANPFYPFNPVNRDFGFTELMLSAVGRGLKGMIVTIFVKGGGAAVMQCHGAGAF